MTEPPGARLRVALTALTVAEFFRDEEGSDTLLFIDNIFRFTQRQRSFGAVRPHAQRRRISAELGYRNGRVTRANYLHEERSVTSVQAIYVPATI